MVAPTFTIGCAGEIGGSGPMRVSAPTRRWIGRGCSRFARPSFFSWKNGFKNSPSLRGAQTAPTTKRGPFLFEKWARGDTG